MGCCVVCAWCCCYDLCGCVYDASPVRFVLSLFYLCAQIHMTGVCLFVWVVQDLTRRPPAFVRSRASHAAGSTGRLAKKTESAHHLWRQDCVDTIYTDVCCITISCRLCLFGTSDRAELPLHNILYTSLSVMGIFSVDLKFCHIRFYTIQPLPFLVFQPVFCLVVLYLLP